MTEAVNFSESVRKSVLASMGSGKDAQCVEFATPSGAGTAGCFEVVCSPGRDRYAILFDRERRLRVDCPREAAGSRVQAGLYSVKCVEPSLMCRARNSKCPFDCFFRGKCRESGVCSCSFFFEGPYCEREKRAPRGLARLWAKLKQLNGSA